MLVERLDGEELALRPERLRPGSASDGNGSERDEGRAKCPAHQRPPAMNGFTISSTWLFVNVSSNASVCDVSLLSG